MTTTGPLLKCVLFIAVFSILFSEGSKLWKLNFVKIKEGYYCVWVQEIILKPNFRCKNKVEFWWIVRVRNNQKIFSKFWFLNDCSFSWIFLTQAILLLRSNEHSAIYVSGRVSRVFTCRLISDNFWIILGTTPQKVLWFFVY